MAMVTLMSESVLTAEDIAFLCELANELKVQNKHGYGNRTPIFIQVREPEKVWAIDPDCADGTAIFFGERGDSGANYTVDEAKQDLIENFDVEPDEISKLESFDDIETFCEENGIDCLIGGYRDSFRYHQAFLTKSAYDEHMKMNGHNYSRASSFWVDSFFRNPQMERLIEIVEKFAIVGSETNGSTLQGS